MHQGALGKEHVNSELIVIRRKSVAPGSLSGHCRTFQRQLHVDKISKCTEELYLDSVSKANTAKVREESRRERLSKEAGIEWNE